MIWRAVPVIVFLFWVFLLSGCALFKPEDIKITIALEAKPNTCEVHEVRVTWRSNMVLAPCFDSKGDFQQPANQPGVTAATIFQSLATDAAVGVGLYTVMRPPQVHTSNKVEVGPIK